ncbi:methyltransferase domain-containing protein [Phascolarctobacterium sp.]|uniref:SAM-dependent methyltransferase n=1 Tax=Phascolarctobacterium sp. TaxID=2049039 RepID=UPI0015AA59A9|nr:methyltransferase domain-containing protein [uncultured Phascolarctobacterium sp.]
MKFIKSAQYDKQFLLDNMMGPNALKILEELTVGLDLHPGMKVLDLGCGKGLTSIFLAKEFGVQVYATDLWITATENYERFKSLGLDELITPIHADATELPYAENYFDAVISVDSYHYFGHTPEFMDAKLAPYVKPGGFIALAVPGFKEEYHSNLPPEFLISWGAADLDTFHCCDWWQTLLSHASTIKVDSVAELTCMDEAWQDWLACDEEHAINDRGSMNAGAGKYMNLIAIKATKI